MKEISRIGIDIGGTFTDLVLVRGQDVHFSKILTTQEDPSTGVLSGLESLLRASHLKLTDVSTLVHGTTLAVNTLIERKGVPTALLTTSGFRDVLEIGLEDRYDLYDLFLQRPQPLVPRRWRYPVNERILDDGSVAIPLDEPEVEKLAQVLKDEGIRGVAVCFLHSYLNRKHEERTAEILRAAAPELAVSLSAEVVPEIREYPRFATTVANVYIQPRVEGYLKSLEETLVSREFDGQLLVMLSAGGTCSVDTACRTPILIVESGPAGGAVGAAFFAERGGWEKLLAFDMGGTTAKATLIDGGEPLRRNEFEIGRLHRFKKGSGLPVKLPVIDLIEIGAGGGSIARVDRLGLLKVGPTSAGSDPGPACYARGGEQPTVTDADLILGYLNPDFFLGGTMQLDPDAAVRSIATYLAAPLQVSVYEAALGIHRVLNENLAGAVRVHGTERGKDLRDYTLLAFGGAGPVHACHVAEILEIGTVVCPPGAGVASAFGFLCAPLSSDLSRSYYTRLVEADWRHVAGLFVEMEREAAAFLIRAGTRPDDIRIERSADMRYRGQSHEVEVPIPSGVLTRRSALEIADQFEAVYKRLYSGQLSGTEVEVLNWRVRVRGPQPRVNATYPRRSNTNGARKGTRRVFFSPGSKSIEVPVYERYALTPSERFVGPAIIEEDESTTVVRPNWGFTLDHEGNLLLRHGERS